MSASDRQAVWKAVSIAGLGCAVLAGCRTTTPTAETPRMAGITQYVRGYEAYQTGNRDAAVQSLSAAVEDNPQLITARSLLAEIYRREGNYEEAARQYERLTQLDPYDYLNYYHLGVSRHLLDRIRAAAEAYERALRLKPDDPKTNMNLGLAYMALGDGQKALPHARKAAELQPDSAAAWGNLALVLDSIGQHAEAEQAYRRSLELDPTVTGVRLNFSTNLIRQNRPQEAIGILERLLEEQKSALAHRRLGDAYVAVGQADRARAQYEAALALNPKYYPAMNELAQLRIREYDRGLQLNEALRREAVNLWKRSLSIQPAQPQVQEALKRWDVGGA